MKYFKLFLLLSFTVSAASISFGQSYPEMQINGAGFEKQNKVEIYPNPTVDFLTITVRNSSLESPEIEIFNILGNKVIVDVERSDDNEFKLNVKDLPAGYYLVSIKDNDKPLKDMYKFLKR